MGQRPLVMWSAVCSLVYGAETSATMVRPSLVYGADMGNNGQAIIEDVYGAETWATMDAEVDVWSKEER